MGVASLLVGNIWNVSSGMEDGPLKWSYIQENTRMTRNMCNAFRVDQVCKNIHWYHCLFQPFQHCTLGDRASLAYTTSVVLSINCRCSKQCQLFSSPTSICCTFVIKPLWTSIRIYLFVEMFCSICIENLFCFNLFCVRFDFICWNV